jgi:hypothetical protein
LLSFFNWIVRRSFWDLRLREKAVSDYISDLLASFARTENLYRIRNTKGSPLESVVEMLLEANAEWSTGTERERDVLKHIGDYVLFMAGLFREYVEREGFLNYYFQEGPRAYMGVWERDRSLFRSGASIFLELSHSFELYVGALNYMKKTFFVERDPDDPIGDLSSQLLKMT